MEATPSSLTDHLLLTTVLPPHLPPRRAWYIHTKWFPNYADPSELFACPTEQKEATPKLKMPAFLAAEAKNADYLVLWLDCDKEGENICFEVMNSVLHVMKQPRKNEQMVFRAKFRY